MAKKPMSFSAFTKANPSMTDDELVAYRAQKRKNGAFDEEAEVETEALSMQARRAKGRVIRRNKAKIALGRRRAAKKIANMEKLQKRARKHARNTILQKILKDVPKDELTHARKAELEKRLEKPAMQRRIGTMAKRMLPKLRKAEIEKKRGGKKND